MQSNSKSPFSGSIDLITGIDFPKKQKLLIYDFDCDNKTSLEETLMCRFSSLNLTPKEKEQLSMNDRNNICHYQNIKKKHLQSTVWNLISIIESNPSDVINIHAEELGAYICLCAVFSKNFPKSKLVTFHLANVPLMLFDKALMEKRRQPASSQIVIDQDGEHWLSPYQSLRECPGHLKLEHFYDESKKTA